MPSITLSQLTEAEAEAALTLIGGPSVVAGDLLAFHNAVLARAEVNKNGDEIDDECLDELAATIRFTPVDHEHIERKVVGFFLDGHVEDHALVTSGVLFAKRFPEETQAVIDGRAKLSVEAEVDTARCSVCGGTFKKRKQYCAHLQDQRATGAVRKLSGLKCVGGGVTAKPAGTGTEFDTGPDGLHFIASEDEEREVLLAAFALDQQEPPTNQESPALPQEPPTPEPQQVVVGEETGEPQVQTSAPDVPEDQPNLVAAMAEVERLTASLNAMTAAAENAARAMQRAFELLKAGMPLAEVEALADKLAGTEPEVLAALVAHVRHSKNGDGTPQTPAPAAAMPPSQQAPKQVVIGDSAPVAPIVTPAQAWSQTKIFAAP